MHVSRVACVVVCACVLLYGVCASVRVCVNVYVLVCILSSVGLLCCECCLQATMKEGICRKTRSVDHSYGGCTAMHCCTGKSLCLCVYLHTYSAYVMEAA